MATGAVRATEKGKRNVVIESRLIVLVVRDYLTYVAIICQENLKNQFKRLPIEKYICL